MKLIKALIKLILLTLLAFLLFFAILELFFPINLNKAKDTSKVLLDRDDRVVYAMLNSKDKWRFRVDLNRLDLKCQKLLLNFEDRRFYSHSGVDFLALIRASWQLLKNGKITSGGSTITMQLARLLEPKKRTIGAKIVEIFRAFQLELHFSKKEILQSYLNLAPYGGNVEGIVGASMRYFGKLPNALTLSQSATLIALPQSPEHNRPDRYKKFAKEARDKVLKRAYDANIISKKEYQEAKNSQVVAKFYNFSRNAPHLSQRLLKHKSIVQSTLYLPLQKRLEIWAKERGKTLPKGATLGVIVANNISGEIVSYIGSWNLFNKEIKGFIDINQAIRSPGSVLKPLIYAIAFKKHIVDINTIIKDKESQFDNYHPHNFNKKFSGEVSVAYALKNSLNIPAVKVLQKVGAQEFLTTLQDIVGKVKIPKQQATLPIALGGFGITPLQVTQLYTLFGGNGKTKKLHAIKEQESKTIQALTPSSIAKVTAILRELNPPLGFTNQNGFFVYKTGTSYGYRDFWTALYSKEYTVVVVVAKADNTPIVKSSARFVASPLAFEVASFTKEYLPHQSWAQDSKQLTQKAPAPTLKYLQEPKKEQNSLQFLYPKEGAKYQSASCQDVVVKFKLSGGKAPYTWYIDGKAKDVNSVNLKEKFSAGGHTISTIDSNGAQAVVDIWVNQPECD